MKIIECVPNFSEGRDTALIKEITDAMESVSGITLLDVDPGADTNRTVVTIVGDPKSVIESAFLGIKKGAELIDMCHHTGAHARMGATDVCPFVPISGTTMDDCVEYSKLLAKRVGEELKIPVFLYEFSATNNERVNLANIRSGEYEGMADKLKLPKWKPDYGPTKTHATAGVTAIGARNFLIAYNINLNTKDKKIATDIALDIREQGRNKRDKNGKFVRDENGIPIKVPGILKSCKAVGWYIDEYGLAQVSMNLTNFNETPPHIAFEESRNQARKRGVRVSGSELVGLIPLESMITAGKYYLNKQRRSTGIPVRDIIHIAVKSMGLDDLTPFDPNEKIIEYRIGKQFNTLASMTLHGFADELSSDSPAPGGGSVAALAGALGASLSSMVANLTFGKKKWDPLFKQMSQLAVNSQKVKDELIQLIDADTESFKLVMEAFKLPNKSKKQKKERDSAIDSAMKEATNIPFKTLQCCRNIMDLTLEAAKYGNPNSVSDAGVGGEMANSGARGAALNVRINLNDIDDELFCKKMENDTNTILIETDKLLLEIRETVESKLING
ncbi:MAG: glutamate formimidoyltransferase [Candidatus Marinimicrobia bacterium]|nr:glutamate formimidoyltransferase [Candidatus Neomarinimicrobiota bacterium]